MKRIENTITYSNRSDVQQPFEAAVIMPSTLRETIFKALESVFAQTDIGPVQILIGIDIDPENNIDSLCSFLESAPDNIAISLINPGYSTSQRHGGMHKAFDGGALRTILSFLANSPFLAYLDDDNWWEKNHLSSLISVIKNKPWAFSHRNYVHQESQKILGRDVIESVGPGKGIYNQKVGGFVDPNCLMIDKTKADAILNLWSTCMDSAPGSSTADRLIFNKLKNAPFGDTGIVTANYVIDPKDPVHPYRLKSLPPEIVKLHYGE